MVRALSFASSRPSLSTRPLSPELLVLPRLVFGVGPFDEIPFAPFGVVKANPPVGCWLCPTSSRSGGTDDRQDNLLVRQQVRGAVSRLAARPISAYEGHS